MSFSRCVRLARRFGLAPSEEDPHRRQEPKSSYAAEALARAVPGRRLSTGRCGRLGGDRRLAGASNHHGCGCGRRHRSHQARARQGDRTARWGGRTRPTFGDEAKPVLGGRGATRSAGGSRERSPALQRPYLIQGARRELIPRLVVLEAVNRSDFGAAVATNSLRLHTSRRF